MMISRRGFFTRTISHGTAAAVVVLPSVVEARGEIPDRFEVQGGWWVQWSGWRPDDRRDVITGWWIGYREGQDLRYVQTTTGTFGPYRPGETFNLSHRETWPFLTSTSSAQELAQIRERSCRELVRRLQGGELED